LLIAVGQGINYYYDCLNNADQQEDFTMTKVIEKRVSERHGFEMPAEIRLKDESADAEVYLNLKTRDISSSGAFLEGPAAVEVGTEMKISLEIPLEKLRNVNSRIAQVTLNGAVVRVSDRGFALSFDDKHDFDFLKN